MARRTRKLSQRQMSQQGFLMKRSGGKFAGSSYGNRKNKLDRRWFRIREGALYYYKQSSEMKESTHHAGKVALEGTQVLAGGDGVTFALVTSSRILKGFAAFGLGGVSNTALRSKLGSLQ